MKPEHTVRTNTLIGAFVAISNGGAAAMMINAAPSFGYIDMLTAAIQALAGLALIAFGAWALFGRLQLQECVLWQAMVVWVLLLFTVVLGVNTIFNDIRSGGRVSWMLGPLTILAWYAYFLARDALGRVRFSRVKFGLFFFCLLATAVDVGALLRIGLGGV